MTMNASGAAIAAVAALLVGTVAVPVAHAEDANVACQGVNACKGANSCKGQGFLLLSQAECGAATAKAKPSK